MTDIFIHMTSRTSIVWCVHSKGEKIKRNSNILETIAWIMDVGRIKIKLIQQKFMCSVCFLFTVMSCDVYGRLREPRPMFTATLKRANGERGVWFKVSALFNIFKMARGSDVPSFDSFQYSPFLPYHGQLGAPPVKLDIFPRRISSCIFCGEFTKP